MKQHIESDKHLDSDIYIIFVDNVPCSGMDISGQPPAMRPHAEAIKAAARSTHVCLYHLGFKEWCVCPRRWRVLLSIRAVDGVSHVPGHSLGKSHARAHCKGKFVAGPPEKCK